MLETAGSRQLRSGLSARLQSAGLAPIEADRAVVSRQGENVFDILGTRLAAISETRRSRCENDIEGHMVSERVHRTHLAYAQAGDPELSCADPGCGVQIKGRGKRGRHFRGTVRAKQVHS